MALFFNRFPLIKSNLRYGVIYIVTSLNSSVGTASDFDEEIMSHGLLSQLNRWLRRLTKFDIEVVGDSTAVETKLVSRRINVGNAGTDATVEMPLSSVSFNDIRRFVDSATDVFSTDEGDQVLKQEADLNMPRNIGSSAAEPNNRYIEESLKSLPCRRRVRRIRKPQDEIENDFWLGEVQEEAIAQSILVDRAEIDGIEEEEQEVLTIEQQQEAALQAIQAQILDYVTKYHADPAQLIKTLLEGKIVIGKQQQPSPLVVNNDLKIVLPHYNEVEVKMPAMCRTIYILFLKHHEGIALRDIAEHRADLEDIYSMVMPGRNEEKAHEAIENLLDPMSNTLNEYISKIKRCFKLCIIDEELASNYIITGKRGEPYGIALDPSLIHLPRAVTRE